MKIEKERTEKIKGKTFTYTLKFPKQQNLRFVESRDRVHTISPALTSKANEDHTFPRTKKQNFVGYISPRIITQMGAIKY